MTVLYVTREDGLLGRRGEAFVYGTRDGRGAPIPSADVESVVVVGDGSLSTPALHMLFEKNIPVHYISRNGWYLGATLAARARVRTWRRLQDALVRDPETVLRVAGGFVAGKLLNQWSTLRRFARRHPERGASLRAAAEELAALARSTGTAETVDELRGIEGRGAAVYFAVFGDMLNPPWFFRDRNRRPPRDPVNAMLSFGYAMLLTHVVTALVVFGLEPTVGFLHPEHRGRPSLALDLMEEFRPLLVDRLVVGLLNQGIFTPEQFVRDSEDGGVTIEPKARRRFIREFEKRLGLKGSVAGEERILTYRERIPRQVRALAESLAERKDYLPFTVV